MKRIIILVIVLLMWTGCSNTELFEEGIDSNDSTAEKNTGKIDMDFFEKNRDIPPLGSSDDLEPDLILSDIKEDINITNVAKSLDITEYDVVIDAKDMKKAEEMLPGQGSEYPVIEEYDTSVPEGVEINLIYDRYNTAFNYILLLGDDINIRKNPSVNSSIVGKGHSLEKMNVVAKVKGQYLDSFGSDQWYEVIWNDINEVKRGYIFASLVDIRRFQLEKMVGAATLLKNEIDNNIMAYIANYKDKNGQAPKHKNNDVDEFGIKRYQSAPAYLEPSLDSNFRYIQDGVLVSVIDETDSFYKIKTLNFKGEYYVEKKYVCPRKSIDVLQQCVVVDRHNQNEAVFRNFNGKWQLISYVYATTGADEQYKQQTELGFFMAVQKREKVEYVDGETQKVTGYAPYTIRFNGGAYIQGVPVNYIEKDGKLTDPGFVEYLFTLGTFPRSHGSVRNYTSHAKFLYEWLEIGKSAVIVIE